METQMNSRVITITSGKGGVGKTTSTANLGTALAMMGKKVAVVDSDIGLRNLDAVLGLENRIVYDLVDVVEGQCRLRQALIKDKRLPDLYYYPQPKLVTRMPSIASRWSNSASNCARSLILS